MNTTSRSPPPKNHTWAFTATTNEQASCLALAMTAISDATCQPLESASCTFLTAATVATLPTMCKRPLRRCHPARHRTGRHTALDGLDHWPSTSKQYWIPKGLPYLTGFVIHCEIVESLAA